MLVYQRVVSVLAFLKPSQHGGSRWFMGIPATLDLKKTAERGRISSGPNPQDDPARSGKMKHFYDDIDADTTMIIFISIYIYVKYWNRMYI